MSQEELIGAFVEGQISRRTFVRRLVAAGVSLSAASSYAYLISAERAQAAEGSFDFYSPEVCDYYGYFYDGTVHFYGPYAEISIRGSKKRPVVNKRRVKVRITVGDPSRNEVVIKILHRGKKRTIGKATFDCEEAGVFTDTVRISKRGKRLIGNKKQPKIFAFLQSTGPCYGRTKTQTSKRLS